MKSKVLNAILLVTWLAPFELLALPEMVIGKVTINPGIYLTFEGAIKDDVAPLGVFLAENWRIGRRMLLKAQFRVVMLPIYKLNCLLKMKALTLQLQCNWLRMLIYLIIFITPKILNCPARLMTSTPLNSSLSRQ